ncbi:hypothetical protein [Dethiobacter alkaliphilus]|uniref:Uncharacterized protein n=1 Tax=Dethiobacter alkaliphilus AHT 1 TaxID=555088 RepID=C0GDV7_DETAL|nr:hypothetical protein [Dethiobacter alkaliphilus]EEG78251.1 conserved hypothetical protein [Dethiobacter alkaliphilus AHT 1]MCW3491491.1 hypothetical protein [Dethiobacter alkaliphilus]
MLKPGFEKQVNLEECRRIDEKEVASPARIRAKVRYDYRGKARPSRFFFGGKSSEEMAVELREQQAALWRNVPVKGIYVEDIIMGDLYTVYDEETDSDVTFAPMELEMMADSLFNLVRFAVRDEFRRIKIMEPLRVGLTVQDMEQVFFEVHEQAKTQIQQKTKRYHD